MRWDELTGEQFELAVLESDGVCLVPLSVIERHGRHLPMGTDMLIGEGLLRRVAERGTGDSLPPYIFTQVPEAQHCLGTINIDPALMVALLDNVCREISRNGLKKIVLVNCHGGNKSFLPFSIESQLPRRQDYTVSSSSRSWHSLAAPTCRGHPRPKDMPGQGKRASHSPHQSAPQP